MNKNLIIAVIVALMIAGGGGFIVGIKYAEGKTREFPIQMQDGENFTFRDRGVGGGNVSGNFTRPGFTPVSGKIISKDSESITVETSDGGSKIILLTDNSNIAKTESADAGSLEEGIEVTIFGQENSDGSITAQNIQIGGDLVRRINEASN